MNLQLESNDTANKNIKPQNIPKLYEFPFYKASYLQEVL